MTVKFLLLGSLFATITPLRLVVSSTVLSAVITKRGPLAEAKLWKNLSYCTRSYPDTPISCHSMEFRQYAVISFKTHVEFNLICFLFSVT